MSLGQATVGPASRQYLEPAQTVFQTSTQAMGYTSKYGHIDVHEITYMDHMGMEYMVYIKYMEYMYDIPFMTRG